MSAEEITLKEYTPEEYRADLLEELRQNGLLETVRKRCQEIDEECRGCGYLTHRFIQEQLAEIEDIIKLSEEG